MLGTQQWEIHPNREVIVRWAGKLIMWWIYGTLIAILLYARGAPNVWSDYVFLWTCVAFFVVACVLGSLALAMLKLLLIAIRRRYRTAILSRHPLAGHRDDEKRLMEDRFWVHVPPG